MNLNIVIPALIYLSRRDGTHQELVNTINGRKNFGIGISILRCPDWYASLPQRVLCAINLQLSSLAKSFAVQIAAFTRNGVLVVMSVGLVGTDAVAQVKRNDPRRAAVAAGPDVRATRTVTSFSDALTCMDGLLLQYGKQDIAIINDGVPDATETLKVGTRDMVISALDAMSLRSGAFRYIDADQNDLSVISMQKATNGNTRTAEYYIKGSISQVDQDVQSGGKKAGVALDFISAGAAKDRSVTNIALELGMYTVKERTLIRGVRSQNTMQIVRSSSSADFGGLLPFASLLFEVRQDRVQGSHQTVRTLIELSMIELIGKFTKVPYWRCLALPTSDPAARRAAEEYFSRMSPVEQISAAQTALGSTPSGAPMYRGSVDGIASPALAEAITRYRAENNLGSGPHVDFELYFHFLTKDLVADGERSAAKGKRPPLLAPPTLDTGLAFKMVTETTVTRGSSFRLSLTPSKDAYFYCYVGTKGDPLAYRIYPNQQTGSQPMTPAGQTLQIPADENALAIKLNDVGTERAACIAREQRYEVPPPSVQIAPLTPIPGAGSLSGLDLVVNEHQVRDRQGMISSVQVREIFVVTGEQSP